MARSVFYFFLSLAGPAFFIDGQAQVTIQQVVAPAGGTSKTVSGYTIDFTVGEAVIATAGIDPTCTEGFHQPLEAKDFVHHSLHLNAVNQTTYIQLSWRTTTEVNNDQFYVERSSDGVRFGDFVTIPSAAPGGNSQTPVNYSTNDNRPLNGANYYRLRQVGKDGTILYSEMVRVDFTLPSWFVQVYPNPVHDQLYIHGYTDQTEAFDLRLMDLQGRIVFTSRISFLLGYNDAILSLGGLSKGIYILYIMDQVHGNKQAVKLLKE